MRSSVLSPMEPVAPSTEIRRGRTARVSISMATDVSGNTITFPSPDEQRASRGRRITQRDQACKNRGGEKAVNAIEQSAVTGNELAHVLSSEAALHCALEEVPPLASKRKHNADGCKPERFRTAQD